MIEDNKPAKEASFEEIMAIKRRSRDRLIKAAYAADQDSLELAAEYVKAALRGVPPIPRPKRFSSLSDEC